jgi:putative acetyltransferase
MYFKPELRGLGIGKRLLELCQEEARKAGYKNMYLETIGKMKAAIGLYEHLGFKRIPNQMGDTGHYSCDVFYFKEL